MRLPDAIDGLRPSIVQIRASGPGTPAQGATIGSGVIVTDSGSIVTARHVLDAIDFERGQTLTIAFAFPDVDTPGLTRRANFMGVEGKLVDVDEQHDLALIEAVGGLANVGRVLGNTQVPNAPAPAHLSTAPLREGSQLAVSGYPLDQPSLVTNAGVLACTLSSEVEIGGVKVRHLGDFTAHPGNSGGPVFSLRDGAVIGVCVAGRLASMVGGLTVIVPAVDVIAMLDRNGLRADRPARVVAGFWYE